VQVRIIAKLRKQSTIARFFESSQHRAFYSLICGDLELKLL